MSVASFTDVFDGSIMDTVYFLVKSFIFNKTFNKRRKIIKDKNMDDKKDKNQHPQVPDNNKDQKYLDNTGLFAHFETSDKDFFFQYKKTEKILTALYLVTNFISTQEPLRWEVRELGLNMLSGVMSLNDSLTSQKKELRNNIKTIIFEIISLLDVATFAGFISNMNSEILKKEFITLLDSVSNLNQSSEPFVLSDDFFAENNDMEFLPNTFPPAHNILSTNIIKDKRTNSIGQQNYKGQNTTKDSNTATKTHSETHSRVEIKKNTRKQVIIDLLKKKKEVMVKDVSALITDCSEKTLQRELLSMVHQGILKKEGERRWSRYSLAR